jgi:tRNA nucleotidyltransferase (CCA-adding enzyme)
MNIPTEIQNVIKQLNKAGYEAYIVGGCVRDLLRGAEPKDWDITTSAKPEEIQETMKKAGLKTFYENEFFTVGVVWPKAPMAENGIQEIPYDIIEITTYRKEAKYSDKRHPDKISFAESVEQDLARRDFTVNAIAIGLKSEARSTKSKTISKSKIQNSKPVSDLCIVKEGSALRVVDPFNGQKDLKNKIIRAVGNPEERFNEDALRMLRAVRFSVSLGDKWQIEPKTAQAIKKNAFHLSVISRERIRDEFLKIIMSKKAADGIELLRELLLLEQIIPEIEEGYGVSQNKHHIYDCYEHNLKSLDYAAKENFSKYVRLAALFHDVAKPRCKQGQGENATFYNHEIISAKMTFQILSRLKFPKKDIEKIVKLVRCHLFYYNVDEVGESSVRRLVVKAGPENMEELLQLRMADRIGSGVPKAEPYKLRHLKYIIDKVSQDPISVKKLKVNGKDIMSLLKIKPCPKVGHVLNVLLGDVLLDPNKNKKELLKKRIIELGKIPDKDLISLVQEAKKEREKLETKRDEMTKKKYWVT